MSKTNKVLFSLLILFSIYITSTQIVFAVPANSVERVQTQPSGEKFKATLQGDENFNYTQTDTGDLVVKGDDGYWYYEEADSNGLAKSKSKYKIHEKPQGALTKNDVEGLKKARLRNKSNLSPLGISQEASTGIDGSSGPATGTPPIGVPQQMSPAASPQKLLVILVGFSNRALSSTYTEADWSNEFFGDTGSTVKNFYKENSGAKFYFTPANESYGTANDGVIKVSLPYAHPNPGGNTGAANELIVRDALLAADPYIDFSSFDTNHDGVISASELHIVTIVAGYEASCSSNSPSVWGHRYFLIHYSATLDGVKLCDYGSGGGYTQFGELQVTNDTHMATIGVMCHELGHDLGLPDLYDTANPSASMGIGVHSLMCYGAWNCQSSQYAGGSPAHFDAWCMVQLGFATPTVMSTGSTVVKSVDTGQYNIIRVNSADTNQYFLLENREFVGFDAGLQSSCVSGGIAIWHIDDSVTAAKWFSNTVNNDKTHKGVDLEEANEGVLGYSQIDNKSPGPFDHYYHLGINTSFGPSTTPNSNLYNGTSSMISISIPGTSSSSMTVQFGSGNANLSGLVLSSGSLSPSFLSSINSYTATVDYNVTGIGVTASLSDTTGAAMTINGVAALSGVEKTINNLSVGKNTINIVVTASDGTTVNTYTVTVTRRESNNADLSGLTVSSGSLAPSFTEGTVDYTDEVAYDASSIDISATSSDPAASIIINGTAVSNSASKTVNLYQFSNTTVRVAVTAADGVTSKTYTITVVKTSVPSVADLESLSISTGTLSPTFSSLVLGYRATATNDITSVNITAVPSDTNSSIKMNGMDAASGAAQAVSLNVGTNIINVVVTAKSGASKVYSITVTRAAPTDAAGQLQFGSSTYSAYEGNKVGITVTRSNGFNGAVSVTWNATGGSAVVNTDFTGATSGTVTFLNGERSKTFSIPIMLDSSPEPGRNIIIGLSSPTGGAELGSVTSTTVNISDYIPDTKTAKNTVKSLTAVNGDMEIRPGTSLEGLISANLSNGISFNVSPGDALWKSSNTKIATVDYSGNITGVSPGKTNVTAIYGSKAVTFHVNTAISGLSGNDSMGNTIGDRETAPMSNMRFNTSNPVTLFANNIDGYYEDVTNSVTWTSSNKNVATVDKGIITTTDTPGISTITGAYGGKKVQLKVNTKLISLEVPQDQANLKLKPGDNVAMRLIAAYADSVTDNVYAYADWRSGNINIATVTDGVVTAVGIGKTNITALYMAKKVTISVDTRLLDLSLDKTGEIELKPISTSSSVILTVTYADGTQKDVTSDPAAVWKSSNLKAASVDNGIITTTETPGISTITAAYGGKKTNIKVNTNLKGLSLSTGHTSLSLAAGNTQTITLMATYSDDDSSDVSLAAEWKSSNAKAATVDNGVIKAVSKGTASISAKYKGKSVAIKVQIN